MKDELTAYSFIDHTADFGIRVSGDDAEALFENAAGALWELLADPDLVGDVSVLELDVSGWDYSDLMFNWLRELLYLWTGKAWLGKGVSVTVISETLLSARIWGEYYHPDRHRLLNDIKAVTYHQLVVEQRPEGGWACQVIFDV